MLIIEKFQKVERKVIVSSKEVCSVFMYFFLRGFSTHICVWRRPDFTHNLHPTSCHLTAPTLLLQTWCSAGRDTPDPSKHLSLRVQVIFEFPLSNAMGFLGLCFTASMHIGCQTGFQRGRTQPYPRGGLC